MDPINILLTPYSLGGLIDVAIAIFGVGAILTATGLFLGLVGYLSAAPFKGLFWGTSSRVIVFSFLQQFVYVISFFLLLTSPAALALFSAFYIPVGIAAALNARLLPKLESYKSMMKLRLEGVMSPEFRNLLGIALVWLVLAVEWAVLIWLNPTLPLISWLLLIYAYLMSLLQAALSHGIIYRIRQSPFVKVITRDKNEFDAFIVGMGSNHYVLTTSSADMVIQSDCVERMVEQEIDRSGSPAQTKAEDNAKP